MTETATSNRPLLSLLLVTGIALACGSDPLIGAERSTIRETKPLQIVHVDRSAKAASRVEQGPRCLPVIAQVDVAVAGGGVAGVTAALAAAEAGLSVALVEPRKYFGYELTASELPTTKPYQPVTGFVLADRLCDRWIRKGVWHKETLNPLKLKSSLHGLVAKQTRIKPYLFSWPCGAVMEGKTVCGLVLANRSGRQVVLAKAVVDATADGRIAAAAGAPFVRTLRGPKRVARTISLSGHNPLKPGVLQVPEDMGLIDNQVRILGDQSQVLQFSVKATIGADLAGDLSRHKRRRWRAECLFWTIWKRRPRPLSTGASTRSDRCATAALGIASVRRCSSAPAPSSPAASPCRSARRSISQHWLTRTRVARARSTV